MASSVVPSYMHNKVECDQCLAVEAKGGREVVADPLSPVYPCILKSLDHLPKGVLSHHPFPLNGDPADRIERLVILMKKLLVKMILSKHKVMETCSEEMFQMTSSMDVNRMMIWMNRKTLPFPGAAVSSREMNLQNDVWMKLLKKSGREYGDEYVLSDDHFGIFDTFAILYNVLDYILGPVTLQRDFKDPEQMFPEDMQPVIAKAQSSTFLATVDRLLDALDHELIPYSELVKTICNGNTLRRCSMCDEEVTVTEITQDKKRLGRVVTFFNTLNMGLVRCADEMCNLVQDQHPSRLDYMRWYPMVTVIFTKFRANLCDFCFKVSSHKVVHRCGRCLTKVYCSKECQTADWDVAHSSICKGRGDARKVKGKAQERKEMGKERVEECVKRIEERQDDYVTESGFFDPVRNFEYGRMLDVVKECL